MKKTAFILSVSSLIIGLFSSFSPVEETVEINELIWMTENLSVKKFRNGDPIPRAESLEDWQQAKESKQPAWGYYRNDKEYGEKFGIIYNGHALNDPRGLAPEGWRVPTIDEYEALINHLGGVLVAGQKLKSKTGWKVRNGTNESGFSAVMSGKVSWDIDLIYSYDDLTLWTSSDKNDYPISIQIKDFFDKIQLNNSALSNAYSVRCVKDK